MLILSSVEDLNQAHLAAVKGIIQLLQKFKSCTMYRLSVEQ